MQLVHAARAMRAVTTREIVKFVQQRGRLLSAIDGLLQRPEDL